MYGLARIIRGWSFFASFLAASAASAGDVTVTQSNKQFDPPVLTIRKGQTVTFQNHDPFAHNVFSLTPGLEFDLKTQPPGKSSDIVFPKAGEVSVQCAIHPGMKMMVKVTE